MYDNYMYIDALDVNFCPSMNAEEYNSTCKYMIGCSYNNCIHTLSRATDGNDTIIKNSSDSVDIELKTLYNLTTVADVNGENRTSVVQFEVNPISLCSSTTG